MICTFLPFYAARVYHFSVAHPRFKCWDNDGLSDYSSDMVPQTSSQEFFLSEQMTILPLLTSSLLTVLFSPPSDRDSSVLSQRISMDCDKGAIYDFFIMYLV